jgi:hypothetical protein
VFNRTPEDEDPRDIGRDVTRADRFERRPDDLCERFAPAARVCKGAPEIFAIDPYEFLRRR